MSNRYRKFKNTSKLLKLLNTEPIQNIPKKLIKFNGVMKTITILSAAMLISLNAMILKELIPKKLLFNSGNWHNRIN